MATPEVVGVERLVTTSGRRRALDGMSLSVQAGEVHGLLGPERAGKTTALRALLGIVTADSGSARVLGRDPWRDRVEIHRRLAYAPQRVAPWPNLSCGEIVDVLCRLRGSFSPVRRDELVARFGLDPTRKARACSTTEQRTVVLVSALASDVELLLLDDPMAELDPVAKQTLRECVAEQRRRGRATLLSSRAPADVEAVCDRFSVVVGGATVESGTPAQRQGRTGVVA